MRILFVSTAAFFPEHVSAQNQTVLELAGALVAAGHEPAVLAGRATPEPRSNAVASERGYGFRLFRAQAPLRVLPVLCATLRPDVAVIVDGDLEGISEQLRTLDVPVTLWFFNAEAHYFRHRALRDEPLYLATSAFLAARVRGLLGVSAEVLPPYIDHPRYAAPAQGRRVLFVNPVRQKGVEIAFALARQRPDVAFTFVESWGLSEQWRQSCFERALACGNIEWVPKTIERQALLQRSRLLLLPRLSEEGFCRLVPEAQAGGVPVLASDRGSLRANVGDGGSVLSVDAQPSAWLALLDRYLHDDVFHAQAAARARRHAQRPELAAQTVVDRLLELLSGCIARHRVRRRSAGQR